MASEILGLFGGQSPQQLRNAALDSMMISPAQMGSQGLLQQVVSMGQNAGTMLGMGAGQLFGGKVAGEVEASYLEDAIKAGQAGKTPAEKMKLVALALEDKPGMGAQYMKALTEARRLEAEDLTIEEAKFKRDNRTRNVNVRVRKPMLDGLGRPIPGQFTEGDITLTQVWNPQTNSFEFLDSPPQGAQVVKVLGTTMPDTGAGAGRGRVNPPLAAETQPVRETAPTTTTTLPPVGQRPKVEVTPQQQAAIAEEARKSREQARMTEEAAAIRGEAPSSSGIQNAEPEAMPMPDEKPQTNFGRGEMEKKKQILELSKLAARYKKIGIDTTQIDQMIAYLRKQLGNSWGNEVRN